MSAKPEQLDRHCRGSIRRHVKKQTHKVWRRLAKAVLRVGEQPETTKFRGWVS